MEYNGVGFQFISTRLFLSKKWTEKEWLLYLGIKPRYLIFGNWRRPILSLSRISHYERKKMDRRKEKGQQTKEASFSSGP